MANGRESCLIFVSNTFKVSFLTMTGQLKEICAVWRASMPNTLRCLRQTSGFQINCIGSFCIVQTKMLHKMALSYDFQRVIA